MTANRPGPTLRYKSPQLTPTCHACRDRALSQVVANADGERERVVLGDLKPGGYFIQLRSRMASSGMLDSEQYRFDIPVGRGYSVSRLNGVLEQVR